jgi:hypothetical protein
MTDPVKDSGKDLLTFCVFIAVLIANSGRELDPDLAGSVIDRPSP